MSDIFYSIRDTPICCGHNIDIVIRQANTKVLQEARLNQPSKNRVRVPTKNTVSLHNDIKWRPQAIPFLHFYVKVHRHSKRLLYLGTSLTSHKCLNRQGLTAKFSNYCAALLWGLKSTPEKLNYALSTIKEIRYPQYIMQTLKNLTNKLYRSSQGH